MKIAIVNNSQYGSGACNGGDYGFTTNYSLRPDGKFNVTFSTTAEFQYCPLCGSFFQGDDCPCGMEHPDVVDIFAVNKEIRYTMIRFTQGEDYEIIIEG